VEGICLSVRTLPSHQTMYDVHPPWNSSHVHMTCRLHNHKSDIIEISMVRYYNLNVLEEMC